MVQGVGLRGKGLGGEEKGGGALGSSIYFNKKGVRQ